MPFKLVNLTSAADASDGAPILEAVIVPNDSLGERGFFIFATGLLAAVAAVDLVMLAIGGWVVALFVAGDAILLLGASVLCRRNLRRSECVRIAGGTVSVARFARRRLVGELHLPVFGLALEREDDPDWGCQRLSLVLRDRRYDVAADLSPDERGVFADHIAGALAVAGGAQRVHRIERLPLMPARAEAAG